MGLGLLTRESFEGWSYECLDGSIPFDGETFETFVCCVVQADCQSWLELSLPVLLFHKGILP